MTEPTPDTLTPEPEGVDVAPDDKDTPVPESGPDFTHLIPRRRVSRFFLR